MVYDLAKYDLILSKDFLEEVVHHIDEKTNVLSVDYDRSL